MEANEVEEPSAWSIYQVATSMFVWDSECPDSNGCACECRRDNTLAGEVSGEACERIDPSASRGLRSGSLETHRRPFLLKDTDAQMERPSTPDDIEPTWSPPNDLLEDVDHPWHAPPPKLEEPKDGHRGCCGTEVQVVEDREIQTGVKPMTNGMAHMVRAELEKTPFGIKPQLWRSTMVGHGKQMDGLLKKLEAQAADACRARALTMMQQIVVRLMNGEVAMWVELWRSAMKNEAQDLGVHTQESFTEYPPGRPLHPPGPWLYV